MKTLLPLAALLLLQSFSVVPHSPFDAVAQTQTSLPDQAQSDETDADDEPGLQRVARISFVEGDVSFLRSGESEWAAAVVNLPLLDGEQVYTGRDSRAEIQLGRGTYLRLSERTSLTIVGLSETVAQFEVAEGSATIRVDHLAAAFDRFEVDTPNAALVLKKDGLYRIDVDEKGRAEVRVRRGLAEVATDNGNFRVREGQKLALGADSSNLEIALDNSPDDWDRWNETRDIAIDRGALAASPDYVTEYETNYNTFYGASDLSSYGSWTVIPSYGNCWIPRVGRDWVPYRHGNWIWVPRAGWTWVSHEPWGWAPYHYGRWVFLSRFGWTWVPGFRVGHFGRSYYWWRPALVAFYNCPTPRGHLIAWHPLHPGERWRRPGFGGHDRDRDRDRDRGRDRDRDNSRVSAVRNGFRRPSLRDGVSIQPVDGFNRPGAGSGGGGRPDNGTVGRQRPQAPDRSLTQWLDNSNRAGLPSDLITRPTIAPALGEGNGRPVVRPSDQVLRRPVVTRNLPPSVPAAGNSNGSAVAPQGSTPRERRLIGAPSIQPPATRGRRLDLEGDQPVGRRDREDRNNSDQDQPARPGRRSPVDSSSPTSPTGDNAGSNGGEVRSRKRPDDGAIRLGLPDEQKGSGNSSAGTEVRGRPRPEVERANEPGSSNNHPVVRPRTETGDRPVLPEQTNEEQRNAERTKKRDERNWNGVDRTVERTNDQPPGNAGTVGGGAESNAESKRERRERRQEMSPDAGRPEPRREEPRIEKPAPRREEPRIERPEPRREEPRIERKPEPRREEPRVEKHQQPPPERVKPQPPSPRNSGVEPGRKHKN